MRVSKLEIAGFKSFANLTTINLPDDIIAIVGPNGCGKSNVSDAIRWVLGNQSPKLLRGKKMGDFIFSGSRNRKPLGMAQVSLTMENGSGAIKFPGLENCTEVTVTRRVYRDGEGEYLINKTPCRLRDVTDLFLDVGIGTNILSVIEQRQVDHIINVKPEERRFIIEEAAGITRYKDRKLRALQKLAHTEDNLLRVQDIMAEVQRQLNSLKRQAGKAERYKKFKAEARELDLAILSTEYQGLAQRISVLDEEIKEVRAAHEAAASSHQAAETRLESFRLNLARNRDEITHLNHEIHRLEKEAIRMESDIQSSGSAAGTLLSEADRLGEENRELREQISLLEGESEEIKRDERALTLQTKEKSTSLQRSKEELEDLTGKYRLLLDKLEEDRSTYIDLLSAISRERNVLNSGEAERHKVSRREAKINEEKSAAASMFGELGARKQDVEARIQELRMGIDTLEDGRETLKRNITEIKEDLRKAQDSVDSLKGEYAQGSARITSQEELLNNGEGYQDGVKTILKGRENGNGLEGIRGVLADHLETSPQYEKAIEAALGEKLQYLVAEDHNQCVKALDYLKSNMGGRSTLIPVNPRPEALEAELLLDRPGVLGLANRLISSSEEHSVLFELLLGNVLVVEDLNTALNLWQGNSVRATMVTLEGEVVDSGGAVTGGTSGDRNGSILQRRRRLREMKKSLEELEKKLEDAEITRSNLLERLQVMEEEWESSGELLKKEEVAFLNLSKELELFESEERNTALKLQAAEYQEQELSREKEEFRQTLERAGAELKGLLDKKSRVEMETQEIREEAATLGDRVDTIKSGVIRREMELASYHDKQALYKFEIDKLQKALEEMRLKLGQKIRQREEAIVKREEELRTVEELRRKLVELEEEKRDFSRQMVLKQEDYTEAEGRLSQREAELKLLKTEVEGSRERLHGLSLRETELNLQAENILQTARTNYSTDLKHQSSELPGEMEECKERLAELKHLLERMGDVNLSALSEYEEQKERHDFLTTQHDDLKQSMEDLHTAIEKINRTTRTRFRESFDKINSNFKEMFEKLFGGGQAELVLTDESDLLESGVDIVARPPGKRLQNITLLSSGEKALTALALLFGVFLSKPSPFCLLDEVDAPLDDPNIERFTKLLRELSHKTQFIIITHNKQTMSAADLLYGVTMEEEGVSKVLSVRLEEAHSTA